MGDRCRVLGGGLVGGGGFGVLLPAGLGCKSHWVVGDDCPYEGLHKGHWHTQCSGGNHKCPSREKHVVPLLEEYRHSVDLHFICALSDRRTTNPSQAGLGHTDLKPTKSTERRSYVQHIHIYCLYAD